MYSTPKATEINIRIFGKLYIYNETHLEFKTILLDPTVVDEEDRFMIVREF